EHIRASHRSSLAVGASARYGFHMAASTPLYVMGKSSWVTLPDYLSSRSALLFADDPTAFRSVPLGCEPPYAPFDLVVRSRFAAGSNLLQLGSVQCRLPPGLSGKLQSSLQSPPGRLRQALRQ